jgi:hypothetical protein
MPILPNQRHEAFAQALAKGKTADDAYALAGYRPHRGNASTLRTNQSILDRLAELQERGAKRVEVTVESLSAELDEARALALTSGQISAAVSATMGKAKLHGKLVERKHVTGTIGTYDLTKLDDDALDKLESILGPLADLGGDPGGEGETHH